MKAHLIICSLLLLAFFDPNISSAQAQGGKKIYDYFNPTSDPHVKWLIGDQNRFHFNPAVNHLRKGDYKRATRELSFLLKGFPNHPKGLMLLSIVAKMTKNPSFGVPFYKKALQVYPQYAITHAQYGNYLVEVGQVKVGIAKLKKAIEMDPKLAPAHAWLAKAYYKIGRAELAQLTARQAKALGYKGRAGR